MAVLCTCERCSRVVPRKGFSVFRCAVFVGAFAATLPYAWLLFVAGPGVVGVLPVVMAIGFGISAGLRDWAFPTPLCPHCGASLEHAPRLQEAQRALRATPRAA